MLRPARSATRSRSWTSTLTYGIQTGAVQRGARARVETTIGGTIAFCRETSMRKLDLLQLSKRLIVVNDMPGIPALGIPIPGGPTPSPTMPERSPARTRDAPDQP